MSSTPGSGPMGCAASPRDAEPPSRIGTGRGDGAIGSERSRRGGLAGRLGGQLTHRSYTTFGYTTAGHKDLLRDLIATKGNITLAEIQAALMARGIEAGCLTTIWSTLRRLGYRIKNILRAAEQDRPDVVVRRRLWRSLQPFMDPERFVFIDETGTSTSMIRRYG